MPDELPPLHAQETRSNTTPWIYAGLGCCIVITLVCCLCIVFSGAAVALFVAVFGRETPNLQVQYDLPKTVAVGEEFDFTLTLTNTGDQPLEVNDINLDNALSASILDGITVLSTDPVMRRDYTVPGMKIFHYNSTLQPHTPATVTFHLIAHTPGEYSGDVAIYSGPTSNLINPFIVITEK